MKTNTYYYLIAPRFTFVGGITAEDIYTCYENQITDNCDDGETYVPVVNKFLKTGSLYSAPLINYVVITIDTNGSYLFHVMNKGFNVVMKGFGDRLDLNDKLNTRKIIAKVLRMLQINDKEIHELGFDKFSRRFCSNNGIKTISQYQPVFGK